jgi:hypothetical protein
MVQICCDVRTSKEAAEVCLLAANKPHARERHAVTFLAPAHVPGFPVAIRPGRKHRERQRPQKPLRDSTAVFFSAFSAPLR